MARERVGQCLFMEMELLAFAIVSSFAASCIHQL